MRKYKRKKNFLAAVFLLFATIIAANIGSSLASGNYTIDYTRGTICASCVNLRDQPEGNIIGKLYYGTPVEILADVDDWHEIRTEDGRKGYVIGRCVRYLRVPNDSSDNLTHGKIIPSRGANVRQAPGTDSPKITAVSKGSTVTILGEESGWYKVKTSTGIEGYILASLVDTNSTITTTITQPDTTTSQIGESNGEEVLLATVTLTASSSTSNRNSNLSLASSTINGTTLQPGDLFSWAKVVGSSSASKGYLKADGFVNGKTVQLVGGGVCQVVTTLYQAGLQAGLEMVDVTPHSKAVTYTDGPHATVSIPSGVDFAFRNNTENVIVIYASSDGASTTVSLYAK